jgi:hypothetical protein
MTPAEKKLEEAEHLKRLAAERAESDPFLAATHCSNAWRALVEAERLGADAHHVAELQLVLHRWGTEVGLPRVLDRIAAIGDETLRSSLYRMAANVARTERDWIMDAAGRGIAGVTPAHLARWRDWPEAIEAKATARAS